MRQYDIKQNGKYDYFLQCTKVMEVSGLSSYIQSTELSVLLIPNKGVSLFPTEIKKATQISLFLSLNWPIPCSPLNQLFILPGPCTQAWPTGNSKGPRFHG